MLLTVSCQSLVPEVTPMMLAACSGADREVRQFLEAGADANTKSKYGWTALMFAASKGNREVVEILLDAGADPHATDELGRTLLARCQHLPTVKKVLLEFLDSPD